MDNQASPWSPEDAMEIGGKIAEENVHMDHIFHDESSSSGEESSLVGTRIDGFLDAAADMIQRHLRINVDGDDEDFDIENIEDEDEDDEYDGDDDESEAFDYSVFSKHTVESITSHHSGSCTSNDNPGLQPQDDDSSEAKTTKTRPLSKDTHNEKSSQQGNESAEKGRNGTTSVDGASSEKLGSFGESSATVSTSTEKQYCDGCSVEEKSVSGLRSIREDTAGEESPSGSRPFEEKAVDDDGSTCSGNQSFGGRSYDERSFAGLRAVLQLESTDDGDENSAWLPSSHKKSNDEISASDLRSIQEDVNDDEGSASGFQSLGMHSTQDTTIDEGSTTGLRSFGMHSTQETTADEETTNDLRSHGLHSTQETTIDEGTSPGLRSSGLHSTQETSVVEGSSSGSRSLGLHSTQETTIDEGSSGSPSFGLHSTQETTIDEGSTSGSQSFGLHSTHETTIDEGSTSGSPSFGMHYTQDTTIETRSSFGLRPIQESPIDEKLLIDDNFPKEEGLFGALSTKKRRLRNRQSREDVHCVKEITYDQGQLSGIGSRASRSCDSGSKLESTYDKGENSRDSDSAYFTDEYSNYDTTFTQSTMTSKHYPEAKVKAKKAPPAKKTKEEKKPDFYVPKKTRDRVQQNPGSRFVDVRDYFIYSDENSIVTQSSFKKKEPSPPKRQTKPFHPKRRTRASQSKKRMQVKRSTLVDKEIKENELYTEDYGAGPRMDEHGAPHLRAISDDVSQITMSVAMSSCLDDSFDGTNSLTTHPSLFESQLETCEECSANSEDYTETGLDTSSVALLSGHTNLDDDQSGKKDSVFDQIRDMGLSMWGKKKGKKEREIRQPEPDLAERRQVESLDLDQEGLNRARLLEIVKREAKLEEAAWRRIERKQAERKDAELKPSSQRNFEFDHFSLKQSFAIKKLDESFFSQQNGDNSLVDSSHFDEDSKSTVSNAISDSILYNRERSQLRHNRKMARNIRKSPSKASEESSCQPTWRSSVSDVGVGNLSSHEKALEGYLTRGPPSKGQSDVLAAIPARGSTPRDKLRARMIARSKFATIDSAKVKRDFLAKSPKSTERIQPQTTVTPKSALKTKARAASPAALSSTGILKTMAPQLPIKPVYRSALKSPASSALKAKRVSFGTPETFEFVMKEDPEQFHLKSKGRSHHLNDSFDVQKRRRARSQSKSAKKTSRSTAKRRQPVTPNLYKNQSPHLLRPSENSSPTSVLDLPSPEDSFSESPRIANLEFLEQQKVKKLVYGDNDDDDASSEQSSVLMDLSVI